MKIGIIGASSNIAGKAYLPVYARLQAQHEFVIYSRELSKAEEIRARYQFAKATNQLANLELCDVVFIHAATNQHFELAKRFLTAGIHVFMDKPISEDFAQVQELYQLAEKQERLFVIGFNRRFLPLIDKLKNVEHKNTIIVMKNLANNSAEARFTLYDIFIHPLDTLIYLLDDEILDVNYSVDLTADGKINRTFVIVKTATTTGIARMNLQSGAFTEEFTVEAESGTYRLSDLTELESFTGIDRQKSGINGWQSATFNRGFDKMVEEMLTAVAGNSADLRQEKIVKSHEIINQIIKENKIN